jgi:hypothetical protein
VKWGDDLYAGVATDITQIFPQEACEIWKYDGSEWTCIVGDDTGADPTDPEYDGFGDLYNKYVWSMDIADNALWAGTVNHQIKLQKPWTFSEGCEVWRYDDTELKPSVEDSTGEKPNGFGEWYNRGARSMIEYPSGSGNVIVGTMTLIGFREKMEGCEIWIRYP